MKLDRYLIDNSMHLFQVRIESQCVQKKKIRSGMGTSKASLGRGLFFS